MGYGIALGHVTKALNRGYDYQKNEQERERQVKRQETSDAQAAERHKYSMDRGALGIDAARYDAATRPDAGSVRAASAAGIEASTAEARARAAGTLTPDQATQQRDASFGADIAAARAKEAGTPTPEQAREAADIKRTFDRMKVEREKLLQQDARYQAMSSRQKAEYNSYAQDVERAIGRFMMSGDVEGIKNVYNRYDDGADIAEVVEGEDGSVTVSLTNGQQQTFPSRREAASMAYGALLDPKVFLNDVGGADSKAPAAVRTAEWLQKRLGWDAERAWKEVNRAKSDPRKWGADLYKALRTGGGEYGTSMDDATARAEVEQAIAWLETLGGEGGIGGDSGADPLGLGL